MKVLVLGDKSMIGELNESLGGNGIQVVSFFEVSEAVATLNREKFDVVILDSVMEKVEDILHFIRGIANAPVVCMVTGAEADWARARTLDADGYVERGAGHTELVARLRAVMRRLSPSAKAQQARSTMPAESGKPAAPTTPP